MRACLIKNLCLENFVFIWPWLFWATYNLPIISESKMENRSENTRARVLRPILYFVFQYNSIYYIPYISENAKHAAACCSIYLIKSKLMVSKLIKDRKLKLREKLWCTRLHIYVQFFQLNIWSTKYQIQPAV